MPSPYATDEDPMMLWFEQAIHASTHIGAMAFGFLVSIYFLATYSGLKQKRFSWWWFTFNTTLLLLGTVNLATSIHFNESAWIDERNYPGGPYAFLVEQQNRPVQTVGNAASVIASTMAEGLLLYRVAVIWHRWSIVFLPFLFFLACTALSIVTVIQLALPFSPTWRRIPSVAFPVWMMLMSLNLFLTLLLSIRLLWMRRRMQTAMGAGYGREYATITAMVVESALPFEIISIVFLVLFGRQDETQQLFLPLLVQVECISPMLIILRVIRGRALSGNSVTPAPMSTAQFASGTISDTQSSGAEATGTHEVSIMQFKPRSETASKADASGSSVDVV